MKLIADKVSAMRSGRPIFAALSFSVEAGSSLLLTGPNGAGKTTLIRSIAGLLPLTAGRLWIESGASDQTVGEHCHYVGHLNAVKNNLTVGENTLLWTQFLAGNVAQSSGALDAFGLSDLRDYPVAYLSAGQRRRLALARPLLSHRPIWLLDEPTVSLDDNAREVLTAVVSSHLRSGGIVIAATHQPLGFPNERELPLSPRYRAT